MRLSRAGVALAVVAIASFAIGRTFGALELFILGAMCLIALLLGVLYTSTVRLDLSVGRTATPIRLRAGSPARIDLSLQNNGRRSTPVLELQDQVQGTKAATVMLAPIRPGEETKVAYRLPTRRRGELVVGPLDLALGDPLGLTRSLVRASQEVVLVVHAQLVDLGALRAIAGRDPTADQQPRRTLATGGDEFFALRPYVLGDELRRVHWPATAKMGDLVVKQQERPRTGRVTVLLDRTSSVYDEEGFERAVSAALSALHAGWRGEDALRYVATGAARYTDIRSRMELDTVDEQLATVRWAERSSLVRTIDEISRLGHGGTLVLVTGRPTQDLAPGIERARRSFGEIVPVICHPGGPNDPGNSVTHGGEGGDFATRWAQRTSKIGGRR